MNLIYHLILTCSPNKKMINNSHSGVVSNGWDNPMCQWSCFFRWISGVEQKTLGMEIKDFNIDKGRCLISGVKNNRRESGGGGVRRWMGRWQNVLVMSFYFAFYMQAKVFSSLSFHLFFFFFSPFLSLLHLLLPIHRSAKRWSGGWEEGRSRCVSLDHPFPLLSLSLFLTFTLLVP